MNIFKLLKFKNFLGVWRKDLKTCVTFFSFHFLSTNKSPQIYCVANRLHLMMKSAMCITFSWFAPSSIISFFSSIPIFTYAHKSSFCRHISWITFTVCHVINHRENWSSFPLSTNQKRLNPHRQYEILVSFLVSLGIHKILQLFTTLSAKRRVLILCEWL